MLISEIDSRFILSFFLLLIILLKTDSKLSINDFHLIKVLGRGAFGKVFIDKIMEK